MALVSPHTRGVSILSAVSAASEGVDVVTAGGMEDVDSGGGARGNRCCRLSCSSQVDQMSMVSSPWIACANLATASHLRQR